MAIVRIGEIREMGEQERMAKLVELKEELAKQKGQVASGTRPDNPGKLRAIRKTIARILTIQHQPVKKIVEQQKANREVLKKK